MLTALFAGAIYTIWAATNTWLGGTGDLSWDNPANWSLSATPAGQDVVFGSNDTQAASTTLNSAVTISLGINSLSFTQFDTNAPGAWHNAWIDAGATLSVTGKVANVLFVGANITNLTFNTRVTISGPGAIKVTNVTGAIQIGGSLPTNSGNNATLDLSRLSTLTANVSNVFIGDNTGNIGNGSNTLILATNSMVIATTVTLGSGHGGVQALYFGAGTNQLFANNIYGGNTDRSSAYFGFAPGIGGLSIRARDGTNRANLFLNYESGFATGGVTDGTWDSRGHPADLLLNQLIVGWRNKTSGSGGKGWSASFSFDQGTLDTTALVAAHKSGQIVSNTTPVKSVVNIGGGSVIIGNGGITLAENSSTGIWTNTQADATLNISGGTVTVGASNGVSLRLGRTVTPGNGLATSALNLTGGTLTLAGDIAGGNATDTNVFALAGGTLDLQGHNLGSAASLITVLNYQSGTLKNVGAINGTDGVVKTGAGTLVLDGTNAYVGPTVVASGTLMLNGRTGAGPVLVETGANLTGAGVAGGSLTNLPGGTLSPGGGVGTLTVTSNATLSAGSALWIELDPAQLTADQLNVGGTLSLDGALIVTNLGPNEPPAGAFFQILNAAQVVGHFSSVQLPALTGAKTWNTDDLYTTGTIAVQGAPNILVNPLSQTNSAGSTITFSALASGVAAYQWFYNGNLLAGQNATNLVLPMVRTSQSGPYYAIVSNVFGAVTSSVAFLQITNPLAPAFVQQPADASVLAGQGVSLVSEAVGAAPLAFQWYFTNGPLTGATNATLALSSLTCEQAGPYFVIVTNRYGSATSRPAYVGVTDTNPPAILSTLTNLSVGVGSTVSVTAQTVYHCSPPVYRWYFNTNTLLPGVTGDTLVLTNVQPSASGTYTLSMSNANGQVTATLLNLQVYPVSAPGTGLTAQYYDNSDFTSLKVTRVDPQIDFDWGSGSPASGVSADTFSARWSGQLRPRYTGPHVFYVTADDGARLWVNDRMIAARTFSSPVTPELRGQITLTSNQLVNIRLEYIETTNNAHVRLEWSSGGFHREVVPQANLYPTPIEYQRGSVVEERWDNVPGTDIAAMTSLSNYPARPDGREFLLSAQCLQPGWSSNYGTRLCGYIVPPMDGYYTFAVAAADTAQFYLSANTNPASKQLIASVTNATALRDWYNQPGQITAPVALLQGQKYYFELLHKVGTGNSHFALGWLTPGATNIQVIQGDALVPAGLELSPPAQTNYLNTLAQSHPRLFATAERFAWLQQQVATNATSQPAQWYFSLSNSAAKILTNAPLTYVKDNRGTILDIARTVMDRIYKLALVYRISGDTNYAERAWLEIDAAGQYPDWDPGHFLDVGEMTHAFAIGYDWMYDYWDDSRKLFIRTNIVIKGLYQGTNAYGTSVGWSKSTGNNWNCVCNGGLTLGALALGTDSETIVEQVLAKAVASAAPVLQHYGTDNGAWYEGPGYWDYASDYNFRMMAGLEWALGSNFGLSRTNGISESGFFAMLITGLKQKNFNFEDAGGAGVSRGEQLIYYARRYYRPEYAYYERNSGSAGPLDLLWYDPRGTNAGATGIGPDIYFHGPTGATPFQPQEVVSCRTDWTNGNGSFLCFKGGEMGASHGHLDAGSFVFEALGKRWAYDLGSDDYALPNYFGDTTNSHPNRWDYYRCRAEGHNTIVINPGYLPEQTLDAVAPVLLFQSKPTGDATAGIVDLTPIYKGIKRAWRGFQLFNDRQELLVQDEIQATNAATVWWFMHVQTNGTQIAVDSDGGAVTLTQTTNRLWLKVLSSNATFTVIPATPLPSSPVSADQDQNTNFVKLALVLSNVTDTTLAVWMKPLRTNDAIPTAYPTITTLLNWNLATNDPPTTLPGNFSIVEDTPLLIDLWTLAWDIATPQADLVFTVDSVQNGSAALLADGHTVQFIPTANFSGAASFAYHVSGASNVVSITVKPINDPPVANAINVTTPQGKSIDIDLLTLANDVETPSNHLLFGVGGATNGSVALLADGHTARFTPATNFFGLASFNYTVKDEGIDPRLLLYYDFEPPDTAADGAVTDQSGKGRTGTLTNVGYGSYSYVSSVPTNLARFDTQSLLLVDNGTNGGAARLSSFVSTNELDLSDASWTMSLWFNRSVRTNDDFLFYVGTSDGSGAYELQFYLKANNNYPALTHWNSAGTTDIALTSTVSTVTGTWHHAAVSFERTNSHAGFVRMYIDGVQAVPVTNVTWGLKQTSPLVFGGQNSTAMVYINRWFNGNLDEISFFNAALATNEIAQLMTDTVAHFGGTVASNSVAVNVATTNVPPPLTFLSPTTNGQFTLRWPAWASAFHAETTSNLHPQIVWLPLTNSVTLTNGQIQTLFPIGTNKRAFFRLKTP